MTQAPDQSPDLSHLKELALAAKDAEAEAARPSRSAADNRMTRVLDYRAALEKYQAASNPPAVLALISRAEAAEAEVARYRASDRRHVYPTASTGPIFEIKS